MLLFLSFSFIITVMGVMVISKKQMSSQTALNIFTFTAFTGMLILAGCRSFTTGNDTPMYIRYFSRVSGLKDLALYKGRFEFLFRVYTCLIAGFFKNPHWYLFISAFIILYLFFRAVYKNSITPWYSILMFLFLMFYYSSMCLLRQYIAVVLTCFAIGYLKKKKWKEFLLLTVAAGLFHTSAFIVLCLLPVSFLPLNKRKRLWYLLGALTICFCFNRMVAILIRIMPKYSVYLASDTYYLQNQLGSFIKIFVWGFLFAVIDYIYCHFSDNSFSDKMDYFIALLGFSIHIMSLNGAILSRMAVYFVIMFCISIPNFLHKVPSRQNKYYCATGVMLLCIVYNLVILIFRPNWSGVLPYTFWS